MLVKEKGFIRVLKEEEYGTSKSGNGFTTRELVVEAKDGDYMTTLHFRAFGRSVDDLKNLHQGDEVEVTYKPQSHEYNGRWYDELRLFGVVSLKKETPKEEPVEDTKGDLPF